jgi:hypothetical protein
MGTTQAHISGQGSSTVEEVARQKTFHLKQRTNKHGEVVTRGDGKTHQATLASAVVGVQNWPTANARDWKDSGPTQGNRQNPNLGTAVVKDAANWLTPQSGDVTGSTREAVVMWASGQRPKTSDQRLRTQVAAEQLKHGQAGPASSSSLGSRQGLWLTPKTGDNHATKHHPQRSDGGQPNLAWQMEKGEQWRTPTSFDWKNTDCSTQVYLSDQVEGRTSKQTDFPTPRTCDWKSSPNADSNIKRMEVGQATLAEFVHAKHKKGDPWSTPRTGATESSRPNNKGGIPLADQAKREQWATPRNCGGPDYAKTTRPSSQSNSLSLPTQVAGKLNPRWVEALMGLPIGWVMPSCTSPQTIAPMSCDSLAMELSLPPQSELSECLPLSWPTPMQMDHWMSNNPRTDGRQDQLPNAVAKYARQP